MRLLQKTLKSNKGLSLLELVVAVAFLAIVITPVMNSFITAGKINAKSRKLMCANDCAQAIMEGIADKSFYELSLAYSKYGNESVSASYALSGVNEDAYNIVTCSTNEISTDVVYKTAAMTSMTASINTATNYSVSIKFADGSDHVFKTVDSISMNGFVDLFNLGFRNDCKAKTGGADTALEKHIYFWVNDESPNDMKTMVIGYSGIEWDGYYFDAVITCIPEGHDPAAMLGVEDVWYSYYVQIDLYDVIRKGDKFTSTFGIGESGEVISPLLSLNTGIKNN